jgi:hypothetical protein
MAASKKTQEVQATPDALELRKVKALEKIANSLEGLTIFFEEIDKQEWSDRIQYYLSEFHNVAVPVKKEQVLNEDEVLNEGEVINEESN